MFHFYFNREPRRASSFDVLSEPFHRGPVDAVRAPSARFSAWTCSSAYLPPASHARDDGGFRVDTDTGEYESDACVLAVTVPALQALVHGVSRARARSRAVEASRVARRDVAIRVWRLWLDTPAAAGRAPFAGTTGMGLCDNISLFHLFEDESRSWAARTAASVVELHAYAVPESFDRETLQCDLLETLHTLYPETRRANHPRRPLATPAADCPWFAPNSHALAPDRRDVDSGPRARGRLREAADPDALMERAATSGILAANLFLRSMGRGEERVGSIPDVGCTAL